MSKDSSGWLRPLDLPAEKVEALADEQEGLLATEERLTCSRNILV